MKVAFIGRKTGQVGASHDDIFKKLKQLAAVLHFEGHEVIIEKETADLIAPKQALASWVTVQTFDEMLEPRPSVNLAIVFGGDGTMLDAARRLATDRFGHLPIIGVNQGRVGFITDLTVENCEPEIRKILLDPYKHNLEKRILLETDGGFDSLALNDVVINRIDGHIIEFKVLIDGKLAYQVRADGLIIATPTGSTAYALSAGGPIISPSSQVIELLPMMPQTLSYRPYIISDKSTVEIELIGDTKAKIFSDGIEVGMMTKDAPKLKVFKSGRRALFLHPDGYDYLVILRNKLNWHLAPGRGA